MSERDELTDTQRHDRAKEAGRYLEELFGDDPFIIARGVTFDRDHMTIHDSKPGSGMFLQCSFLNGYFIGHSTSKKQHP